MGEIKVGDTAPEVSAVDQNGRPFVLSEFHQRKWAVLFFYPKDGTPVCTKEACQFRDAFDDFVAAGAEVVGISSDSVGRHQEFAAAQRLQFRLLSDADGKIRKAFGVPTTLGIFPGRVTYVVDPDGVVRHVFNSQFDAAKHVKEALRILHAASKPGLGWKDE